jgi:paraquat-inducible protein A
LDLVLALTLSGVITLIIANVFPFISLNLEGVSQETTLITGALELYQQDMQPVAILVLATGMMFPILVLVGLTYLLIPLKIGRIPWKMAPVFRLVLFAQPWAMMEVFLLGIVVALVKLSSMATVTLGIGLYAFVGLVFIMAAMNASLNPENIWARLPVER